MRNDVTIVSALFNIEREGMDGRDWEEYLKWFEVTLQLKCNMTVFVTEDIVDFVKEKRGELPTEIVVQSIDDIPYYHLKDQIQEILDSEEYKEKMLDPNRIECKHAIYSIIQYSKFQWIKQAIQSSSNESNYYLWLDAGASRFLGGIDLSKPYPSDHGMEFLEGMGESSLFQINCINYHDLYAAKELPIDYLWDNRSYVNGHMFGVHKNVIPQLCKRVEDLLLNKLIAVGNVNNEQIALGYLIKKFSDEFTIYEKKDKYLDIFYLLFKE